jgi:phosphoenolpyruvate carboxykinase (ATP)
MSPADVVQRLLETSGTKVRNDASRRDLIGDVIARREAFVSACGALATWAPPESTGRSPKDTVTVRRPESEAGIDWDSPNNVGIEATTFDMLLSDALAILRRSDAVWVTHRALGADPAWTLPVTTVTDRALTALFTDNMFRPLPPDLSLSHFADRPFTIIALPWDKLDPGRYAGRLRVDPATGRTSRMAVALDYDRRMGIVIGSAYLGSVKKMAFTAMNYYLPAEGILPMHCSANEGRGGDTALMLGLSGTGKTTLSADPLRALLGDDEHGWGPNGVANFEYGCYAKLIHLDPEKEPAIHNAVFHKDDPLRHGSIIENAMMYPWGEFDLDDERLTPNSRASYPLTALPSIKDSGVGGHPSTILFLTADANGVLPPVSRLSRSQAMLWFLMGYTSKLAGTETGVSEPGSTFSRFFGEPFMPRLPHVYAQMLGERLDRHGTDVYLVNTGWGGGPHGIGRRMDIRLTRSMVNAALSGALKDVGYDDDPRFHLQIPRSCPGVPDPSVLRPRSTWSDPRNYDAWADRLAAEFAAHFKRAYGNKGMAPEIAEQCPGL